MTDPFQDVDAAGEEFKSFYADAMDIRQAEATMERIVADYLAMLSFGPGTLTVENGCGAGAVTRRIAAATPGQVKAFDLSKGFIAEAKERLADVPNAEFAVSDGAIPLADGAVDHVIMHTLLTHVVEPQVLVDDAARLLKPGGRLVICDGDFAKGTLRSARNDPLGACSDAFIDEFVTNPFIASQLKPLAVAAGLKPVSFKMTPRVVDDGDGMLSWVIVTTKNMVARGEIGQPLADALAAEYIRRKDAGTLFGFQAFATLVAEKPA